MNVFDSKDLGLRYGVDRNTVHQLSELGFFPEKVDDDFWCVEDVLLREMKNPITWPSCIFTIDTATIVGLEGEAREAFAWYQACVLNFLMENFMHTPMWNEVKEIFLLSTLPIEERKHATN